MKPIKENIIPIKVTNRRGRDEKLNKIADNKEKIFATEYELAPLPYLGRWLTRTFEGFLEYINAKPFM